MNFKPGQRVICIIHEGWYVRLPETGMEINAAGPKYDEITTVEAVVEFEGECFLVFEEYAGFEITGERESFHHVAFRALDESFAENVLENICKQIEKEELVIVYSNTN